MNNIPVMPSLANQDIYEDFNSSKRVIKDNYDGVCIVIANGPSLAEVPDEFLAKYPTFGTNNIYLRGVSDVENYSKAYFHPTFYTIVGADQLLTPEQREWPRTVIEQAELAFVNRLAYRFYDAPNVYAIHGISVKTRKRQEDRHEFSLDPFDWVGLGYTNVYVMLQIVYHLGFEKVLCVGLDNDYGADPEKLHFYPNDDRFACEPAGGRYATQKGSSYVFGRAKKVFEADGRQIINVNRGNNTPFEHGDPDDYWDRGI